MNSPKARVDPAPLLLALLLALTIVGTRPFSGGQGIAIDQSGEGDMLRQILLLVLGVGSLPLLLARWARVRRLMSAGLPLLLLLAWAVVSVSWSSVPDIAARRLSGTILATMVIFAAATSPTRQLVKAVALTLAGVVFADLAGVLLAPESSLDNLGAWAGMHPHKNVAGLISALTIIVWITYAFRKGAWLPVGVIAVAAIFLIQSNSKTSVGLLALVLLTWFALVVASASGRYALFAASVILASFTVVALVATGDLLSAGPLDSEITFTGRTYIWEFVLSELNQVPITGVGYGSFWAVGPASPSLLRAIPFVAQYTEAHNGYLDVAISLGAVGLTLLGLAMLGALRAALVFRRVSSPLLPILLFSVTHNLLESTAMQGLNPLWLLTLLCILKLGERPDVAPRGPDAGLQSIARGSVPGDRQHSIEQSAMRSVHSGRWQPQTGRRTHESPLSRGEDDPFPPECRHSSRAQPGSEDHP